MCVYAVASGFTRYSGVGRRSECTERAYPGFRSPEPFIFGNFTLGRPKQLIQNTHANSVSHYPLNRSHWFLQCRRFLIRIHWWTVAGQDTEQKARYKWKTRMANGHVCWTVKFVAYSCRGTIWKKCAIRLMNGARHREKEWFALCVIIN